MSYLHNLVDEEENDENLYQLLEVNEDATESEIKQKFNQLKEKYSNGDQADSDKVKDLLALALNDQLSLLDSWRSHVKEAV